MTALRWLIACCALIATLTTAVASQAYASPELLDQWGVAGKFPGELDDLRDIAVDAAGNVFLVDRNRLQKFLNDGTFVFRVNKGAGGSFSAPEAVAIDEEGNVYVADTGNSKIHKFSNDGETLVSWDCARGSKSIKPFGIVVSDNRVCVRTISWIREYTLEGEFIFEWEPPFSGRDDLLVGDDGCIYIIGSDRLVKYDSNRVLQFDRDLVQREEFWLGRVSGAVLDDNGRIHVVDSWSTTIMVFNQDGASVGLWGDLSEPTGIDRDASGNIYVADASAHLVNKFAPPTEIPPLPPVPQPAIALHIEEAGGRSACAESDSVRIDTINTAGLASPDGSARYYVYILASPTEDGISGVQLGIEYDERTESDHGVKVFEWISCADMEWPDERWPASGSGNTITWLLPEECQTAAFGIAGYFYVAAYSPSVMSVVGFPHYTGVVKIANCRGAEVTPEMPLGSERLGWISFGWASKGLDTDGCNPIVGPCNQGPTPIRQTTWGRIKTMYDDKSRDSGDRDPR